MLDIFNSDAFGVIALTDTLRDLHYVPGRIGEMGLFQASSVSTTSVAMERIGDMLKLVSPKPRGAPAEMRDYPKANLKNIRIPHFPRSWAVYADEVQGIRAFGSETALKTVQGLVAEKLAFNMRDYDVTEEVARLGAVMGIITYADGSTLNLFTEFGVAQESVIDFDLDDATPEDGELRGKCVTVIRTMRKKLGGLNFGSVHCFCGDNFFDLLLAHKEVRDTYQGWSEAQILRDSYVGQNRSANPMFQFGGIVFENYGAVADEQEVSGQGVSVGVGADDAHFFPTGVPGLFRTYYAPADYMETVNTPGERLYARQWDMPNGKGRDGEMQMNALQLCTRPTTLLKGSKT